MHKLILDSWLRSGSLATEAVGGWPKQVVGPSPIAWNEDHATPKELSKADIEDLKKAWAAAVKRALECGFDTIEIHNAHVCLPGRRSAISLLTRC